MTRSNIQRLGLKAGAPEILQAVTQDGAAVIQNFLTPEQVTKMNEEVDPFVATAEPDDPPNPSPTKDPTESKTQCSLIDRDHTVEKRRVTNLVHCSETYRQDVLNHSLMHKLCQGVFEASGDYWISSAMVMEMPPGNPAQVLHRDQTTHMLDILGPRTPEVLVNFFVALTDFTESNGGTRMILGSHRWENVWDTGCPEQTIGVEMKAGDALFFSGRLVHGAGHNQTTDFYRRGLSMVIVSCYLTPLQSFLDIPQPIVESLTPTAQKMIGRRRLNAKNYVGLWKERA